MNTRQAKYKDAYERLCLVLDNRDKVYIALEKIVEKHGKIPKGYEKQWLHWIAQGKKPWRENREIVRKIKKTARMISKK